jgi:hypothetical protein
MGSLRRSRRIRVTGKLMLQIVLRDGVWAAGVALVGIAAGAMEAAAYWMAGKARR